MKFKFLYIFLILILIASFFFYYLGYRNASLSHSSQMATELREEKRGEVYLDKEQQQFSGIKIFQIKKDELEVGLVATGVLEADPSKVTKITSRVTGKVLKIFVNLGDKVKKGDTLLLLDSVEIALARANLAEEKSSLLSSMASLEVSKNNLQRIEELFKEGISSKRELEQAQAEYQSFKAGVEKCKTKLEIAKNVLELLKVGGASGKNLFYIASPQDGIVTEWNISLGEAVEPSKPLLTIMGTNYLWAIISIYEKDLEKVKIGNPVKIVFTSFPGKSFLGQISNIGPILDPKTRTVKARVRIENPEGILRPEMFLRAFIVTSKKSAIFIPKEAVQRQDGEFVVYLALVQDKFAPRKIKLGVETEKYYEVLEGLISQDRIVSEGSFTIKSEFLKETIGEEE